MFNGYFFVIINRFNSQSINFSFFFLLPSSGPATIVAFFDIDMHRTFYIDLSDPDNVVELTTSFPANDFLLVTQMSVYGKDMFWTKTGDSAGSNAGVYSMTNYTSSRDLKFKEVPSFDHPVGLVISNFEN